MSHFDTLTTAAKKTEMVSNSICDSLGVQSKLGQHHLAWKNDMVQSFVKFRGKNLYIYIYKFRGGFTGWGSLLAWGCHQKNVCLWSLWGLDLHQGTFRCCQRHGEQLMAASCEVKWIGRWLVNRSTILSYRKMALTPPLLRGGYGYLNCVALLFHKSMSICQHQMHELLTIFAPDCNLLSWFMWALICWHVGEPSLPDRPKNAWKIAAKEHASVAGTHPVNKFPFNIF